MVADPQISTGGALEDEAPRRHGPQATAPASAAAEPAGAAAARRRAWTVGLAVFALGSALLLWAFRAEIEAAVTLWSNSSTYGYAFFVLPIVIFLMVRERGRLALMTPVAQPLGLLLAAGLTVLWMLGELANVMVVQQLAFVGLWQTLFLIVMGWRVTRAVLFPLA